jgi:hypothetical protein
VIFLTGLVIMERVLLEAIQCATAAVGVKSDASVGV